jgi:hypothetical protein
LIVRVEPGNHSNTTLGWIKVRRLLCILSISDDVPRKAGREIPDEPEAAD